MPSADSPHELARSLTLVDAVALFVGIILGSGIFFAPAAVALVTPSLGGQLAFWLAGGLIAAAGAFTYAECATRMPRDGGFLVYYREAFGGRVAFAAGWAALVVTYPASLGAIARGAVGYAAALVPGAAKAETAVAVLVVLAIAGLNSLGAHAGPWTQRALTGVKVAALVLLCLAALVGGTSAAGRPGDVAAAITSGAADAPLAAGGFATWALVIGALVAVLWTYDGWTDVTMIAGEVREPEKNLVRAVTIGLVVLVALYVLVQVAVHLLLGAAAAGSSQVLADATTRGLGERAGRLLAALAVVSSLGSLNGILLASSRLGYAMAREGLLPAWLGVVAPGRGVPLRSTWVLALIACVYAASGSFRELLAFFGQTIWVFYGATAVALLVLRRRGARAGAQGATVAGPVAPIVLIVAALAMTTSLAVESPTRMLIGLALLAAGAPVYGLMQKFVVARSASSSARGQSSLGGR